MPPGSLMVSATSLEGVVLKRGQAGKSPGELYTDLPVIGALDTNRLPQEAGATSFEGPGGRMFLFGDSSCADDAAMELLNGGTVGGDCLWLFKSAVRFACEGFEDPDVFRDATRVSAEEGDGAGVKGFDTGGVKGYSDGLPLPERPANNELVIYPRGPNGGGGGLEEDRSGVLQDDPDTCGLHRWQRIPSAAVSS